MEKPAAKATAATVDLAIGRNRSEGERSPLKLCSPIFITEDLDEHHFRYNAYTH